MDEAKHKHHHRKAVAHFKKVDPILAEVILSLPYLPRGPKNRVTIFSALTSEIISQQLSTKAARAIVKRFKDLFPGKIFPRPRDVLKTSTEKLRSSGLSYAKVEYVKAIAASIHNGQLKTRRLRHMTDEQVIEELTKIKGIGRWTAEMFLMFVLERPDVFSHGDLGLRKGIQLVYGFKKPPTKHQIEKIVQKWSPYKTTASRYLWRSLDSKK